MDKLINIFSLQLKQSNTAQLCKTFNNCLGENVKIWNIESLKPQSVLILHWFYIESIVLVLFCLEKMPERGQKIAWIIDTEASIFALWLIWFCPQLNSKSLDLPVWETGYEISAGSKFRHSPNRGIWPLSLIISHYDVKEYYEFQ